MKVRQHSVLLLALIALGIAVALYGPLEDEARAQKIITPDAGVATSLGEIVTTRMTGAFRAFAINAMWMRAITAERNYQWYQLRTLYHRIRMLQPRYPDVWVSNVGTLAFQLSWDEQTPDKNWEFIREAIDFGKEGVTYNPDDPLIPEKLADVYRQKIGNTLIQNPATGKLEYYYRAKLMEDRGERYSEQVVAWLEIAASKPNCRGSLYLRLWHWYTILRYRALGASQPSEVAIYEKKLKNLEKMALERFPAIHNIMTEHLPYSLSVLRETMKRMTLIDLILEEPDDSGRWAMIHGALLMADDTVKRIHRQLGDHLDYADVLAFRAMIYFRAINSSKALVAMLWRDRSEKDCFLLAKRYYSAALGEYESALTFADQIPTPGERQEYRQSARNRMKLCTDELEKISRVMNDTKLETR